MVARFKRTKRTATFIKVKHKKSKWTLSNTEYITEYLVL